MKWLCFSILALCFTGCAIHPCGEADTKPSRADFEFTSFQGKERPYEVAMTRGRGAPMLITHGLGGLDEATLEWATKLSKKGWKVYLPLLDGEFGKCEPIAHSARMRKSGHWKTDKLDESGKVLEDVKSLANWISTRHGGKRIVVVGNCLTGGFPLALLGGSAVKTAVLCQPAMPAKRPLQALLRLPQSSEKRKAFGISKHDIDESLKALKDDSSKRLYGFHYLNDSLASMDKFVWLHEEMDRREIASKFRPIVLIPRRSKVYAPWWERMDTDVKGGWLGPHVTLTGAAEPDRRELRSKFHELVRP